MVYPRQKRVFAIWVTNLPKDQFSPPLRIWFINLAVVFSFAESMSFEICIPSGNDKLIRGSYDFCTHTQTPADFVDTIFSWVYLPRKFCYYEYAAHLDYALIASPQLINPFKTEKLNSIEILAQIVFRHGNISLFHFSNHDNHPTLGIHKFSLYEHGSKITLKFTGWEFLTCYAETGIDFEFYITPFQPALWISVAVSVALIISVTLVALYFTENYKVTFSPWLFILATLFEETVPIPGKIEKLSWLRMIFTSWCLMSVILTNCYNGLMITELNAPFRSYSKETFPGLSCGANYENGINSDLSFLKEVVPYHNVLYKYAESHEKENFSILYNAILNIVSVAKSDCFSLLSLPYDRNDGFSLPEFLLRLHEDTPMYKIVENELEENPLSINSILNTFDPSELSNLNLLNPKHTHFPRSIYASVRKIIPNSEFQKLIESEIVLCRKSVFIAESDNLAAEFEFLSKNYFWIKFTRGKEVRTSMQFGLIFDGEGFSKIPGYYKILIESGIYHRVDEEMQLRKWARRHPVSGRSEAKPAMMQLDGGLVTPFVLCSAVLLGAISCFLVESWRKFGRVFKYVSRRICTICKNFGYKGERKFGKQITSLNYKVVKVKER